MTGRATGATGEHDTILVSQAGVGSQAVDGIHDMGGMHGFGPIEPEVDEPVFHEWWEAHAAALSLVTAVVGLRSTGIREGVECLDPAVYVASSYYERWARSLENALVDAGTLTAAEIDDRSATVAIGPTASQATNPEMVELAHAALWAPGPTSGVPVDGQFAVGDRVTVRRMAPAAHHRCPRYVRGVTGVVERAGTGWPHAGSSEPEAVYTVRFAMEDLWGDDAEPGHLHLDLWERYLA
jgi:nitrile hydratase subunit beta